MEESKAPAALAHFVRAERLAPKGLTREKSLLGIASTLLAFKERRREGLEKLRELAATTKHPEISSEVDWELAMWSMGSVDDSIADCRAYLKKHPESTHRAEAHERLAHLLEQQLGYAGRAVLEQLVASWERPRGFLKITEISRKIERTVIRIDRPDDLVWLAETLNRLPPRWEAPFPALELTARAYERAASISQGENAIKAARDFQATVGKLVTEGPNDERKDRWRHLEGQAVLMEGQLLLRAGNPVEALTVFARASGLYRAQLERGQTGAGQPLLRIGRILESRRRPDGAAYHYRLVAEMLVTDKLGAEALYRLARVYLDRLDQPLKAIETLRRYHDLYPPTFRIPSSADERITRLGYPDVVSFQAAQGLKVDGVMGPKSLAALVAEEENFREILPARRPSSAIQGKMVHETIFQIARDLEERSRYREAARAYQTFLGMYPGNRRADDALLSLARIFRGLDLFEEAAAAYERLMEDYPQGDQTSHAYIEAAFCYEGLSAWKKAEALYDLYLKKFPRYNRAGEARKNLAAARKLIRYAELVEDDRLSPSKMADARYEMGRLLYHEIGNRRKAAEVFTEVADRFPESYQGPDARYTAGTCLLHEENFERARASFRRLIETYPESRLADDALYWIGHTHEYQARALGKLDEHYIVLKKRSAEEGDKLRADLDLRRVFHPDAQAGAAAWHDPHPDVLTAGSHHEKVRDGIHRAIKAYRETAENHPLGDMAQKALLRVGALYTDYLKNPDKAIDAYRALLEKYPGSAEAVNAQYEVGRHFLEADDLPQAEKSITLFLASFPNHPKAADALLNLAECHRRQKEWLKALDGYQSFVNRYPRSNNVKTVQEEIAWIKKYRF